MKRVWILIAVACVLVVMCSIPLMYLYVVRPGSPAGPQDSPQRIVSLSPNLTEILFSLGLGDKVVGVSNNCDWPGEAKEKAKVGTFWQPNTEAIIAVKPNLVVTEQFEQQKAAAQTLRRVGINVISVRAESIAELFDTIKTVGDATGAVAAAQRLAKDVNDQLGAIRAKYAAQQKVRVLWVVQGEPLRAAGRKTFINEMIELVGGENAIGPTIQQYPLIGGEEILGCGAEVIIESAMDKNEIAQQQARADKFWARYANLPAVRDKRIYVVEPDMMLRLGPRLPQGAEIIADRIHACRLDSRRETRRQGGVSESGEKDK